MLRRFKNLSIRTQLIFLAAFMAAASSLIIFAFYSRVSAAVEANSDSYSEQIIGQAGQSIGTESSIMENVLSSLCFSRSVQNYLQETNPLQRYYYFKDVDALAGSYLALSDCIRDIIISSKGTAVYVVSHEDAAVYDAIRSHSPGDDNHFSEVLQTENGKKVFLLSSTIYSIYGTDYMNQLGTVTLVLDASQFSMQTRDSDENWMNSDFILFDRNGTAYSETNPSFSAGANFLQYASDLPGTYRVTENNLKYKIRIQQVAGTGGKILAVESEPKLLGRISWARGLSVEVMVVMALMAGLFAIVINNILHPMKQFMEFIASIRSGKSLQRSISLQGYSEIRIMSEEFSSMLSQISTLTAQLVETKTNLYATLLGKKEAELNLLKSQINPHFLANTLETIKGYAITEHAASTYEMLKNLGKVLRYSLRGEDIVPLSEELEVARSFLRIHEMKYDGRLITEYDISADSLHCLVPKVILQPVIENAVVHGTLPVNGSMHVRVSAKTENGLLRICVYDDGGGIPPERLQELREEMSLPADTTAPSAHSGGIGLSNVSRRLKLNYGSEYGLDLSSEVGRWTKVTLTIPAAASAERKDGAERPFAQGQAPHYGK